MSQEQMSRGIEMIESAVEKIRQETTQENREEKPLTSGHARSFRLKAAA